MEQNNINSSELNILIISSDTESCAAYAQKAPENVRIICCGTDSKSIEQSLYEFFPHAVFVIFRKGEHPGKKNFNSLYRYITDNSVYFGAMGSRIQLSSLNRGAEGITVNTVSTPRELRDLMVLLRSRRAKHISALERHAADREKGRPPVIVIVTERMSEAFECENALSSYAAVNDREYRLLYINGGLAVNEYLSEKQVVPGAFIFYCNGKSETAVKMINSVMDSPEYGKTPFVIYNNGSMSDTAVKGLKKKPSVVIDADKGKLAASVEKILKNKG